MRRHAAPLDRPRLAAVCAAMAACAFLASCAQPDARTDPPHAHGAPAQTDAPPDAIAPLRTPEGRPAGEVSFTETAAGVVVKVRAEGLAPGRHGFHIHTNGACEPGPDPATGGTVAFGAAGGHFDPRATHNHGGPDDPDDVSHAGELPNLTADASGRALLAHATTRFRVSPDKTSVMNRTVVVHADADDYRSDPAGASGARVLCGVIAPASPGVVVGRTTLPGANAFPEGIAVDVGNGDTYVGSAAEGHLYRFKPGAKEGELFQRGGSPGRQGAYGLKVDGQRQLWVAGGPHGTLAVVDLASATTRAQAKVPPGEQSFVNDLVIAQDHVYVTDSSRPVVYRVARAGRPLALEPWLDLNASPVRYKPNEVNLNGIVASPDGSRLLAIQSSTGQLWRIDTRTKAVSEVASSGGSLLHGDGLVLRGPNELFVVRNVENEIARVELSADWSRATVSKVLRDPRFKYPTTAASGASDLLVVNGQLDRQKTPPPLLPFDVVVVASP